MFFYQNYTKNSLFLNCVKKFGKVKENYHSPYCPYKQHWKHESLELHGFETCHAEKTGRPMLSRVVTQGFRLTNIDESVQ
jgi:hypothetical protein